MCIGQPARPRMMRAIEMPHQCSATLYTTRDDMLKSEEEASAYTQRVSKQVRITTQRIEGASTNSRHLIFVIALLKSLHGKICVCVVASA